MNHGNFLAYIIDRFAESDIMSIADRFFDVGFTILRENIYFR